MISGCALFGEERDPEAEVAAEEEAQRARLEPVQQILKLEIGRLSDGFVITAFGLAPRAGYANPVLSPRRDGRPGRDGFVEFDFQAQPPDPALELPQGEARQRQLRADRLLRARSLQGVAGVRVYGLRNTSTIRF